MLRVAVATSGGRDSTALLHCTVRTMAAWGGETWALHVHHGLQAAADDWLSHVRRQATRWGARFDSRRLQDQPLPGDSIEAWARQGRYRALTEMAQAAGCDLVLLAHHRRDQAETWLLQALRGAGFAGLSAMPSSAQRGGLTWARPWLHMPREAIEAYVQRHRIRHIDDPSNDDPRYARNRLRIAVWPVLTSAFPDAETAFIAAAAQSQHGRALAREVLDLDLPGVTSEDGLDVAAWLKLPAARRRNVLQGWLALQLARGAPDSLLNRLCEALPQSRSASWEVDGRVLRLYRGRLRVAAALAQASGAAAPVQLSLLCPGSYVLPGWQGRFEVVAATQQGLPAGLLGQVEARPRSGGERFRLAPRAAARSLKKQYQARAIAAWQRQGPLLFTPQGRLLFVPGLGVDATVWAAEGEPQLAVRWVSDVTGVDAQTGQGQAGS